ncbi:MAG: aminotransferase class V-fold PLP-dependent enzyme [Candidatus Micrarchaeota archaeon]|nr:aminotransferase class V-fold PLP-dependent enzyme [Candidatus Micrarchaeota archaeon]
MAFDIGKIREDFPILSRRLNGKQVAYLDNAATTQKPSAVLDAMRNYYENRNANVHRGGNALAEEATEIYENARKRVARFIGAAASEIVFTRNATEALNIAARFCTGQLGAKCVLLTEMEHHSNIVNWQLALASCLQSPMGILHKQNASDIERSSMLKATQWQLAAKAAGARIGYVKMRSYGKLCNEDVEKKLSAQQGAFSFTHASNVLGAVNDADSLCRLAKKAGALSVVDGAQTAPHMKIDVHGMGCDFFAFSAHKMLGPTGVGVLYVKKELADKLEPVFGGGGAIESVALSGSTFAAAPQKFEPGTQDVAGAVGLSAAMDYLESAGMDAIEKHVSSLHKACLEGLKETGGVHVYGNGNRTGIVSFNVGRLHAHDISQIASDDGIMLRAGHHCAQPLMKAIGAIATVRASFYIYNTDEEANRLAASVKRAKKVLS